MNKVSCFLIVLFLLVQIYPQDPCLPLWPRLQFGSIYSDFLSQEKLLIKFNTRSQCPKSFSLISDSKGTIRKIYCLSSKIRCSSKTNDYQTYIQRCSISQIQFQQNIYYYIYGSNTTAGTVIPFTSDPIQTKIVNPNVSLFNIQSTNTIKLLVFADWSQLHSKIGIYKSVNQTIDKLRIDQNIQGIILNGDFAYDLDSNNGINYEQFLNMLSRSGRFTPVLSIAGNHQHNSIDNEMLFYGSFQQYGANQKLASTITIGSASFATFDPYFDIYTKFNNLRSESKSAYEGFVEAIKNASSRNRIIIPISHYPLKCSAKSQNCQNDAVILKKYFDLMFDYNVKFYIGAHYHTYQRLYPYCKNNTFILIPSPYSADELDKCMLSILEGIAGNDDKIVESYTNLKNYTAKVSFNKTGVGLLSIKLTQIDYQHYSSNNIATLQDQFTIIYNRNSIELVRE